MDTILLQVNEQVAEVQRVSARKTAEQNICVRLVSEAAIANTKFSEYHNIYMEIGRTWSNELRIAPQLFALNSQVDELSDWMTEFESKVQAALTTLEEITETQLQKSKLLMSILRRLYYGNNLNVMQEVVGRLTGLTWVDLWPNAQQLEVEWRDKNILQSISRYTTDIAALSNTPENVLIANWGL